MGTFGRGRAGRSAQPAGHQPDDGAVGFPHSFAGQRSDVADGVLHPFDDDAVPAVKFALMLLHLPAQQTGLDRRSDFGGAAGLGAVADHAGINGHRIDDGVGNLLVPPAVQVTDAGPSAAPGGGGAAVGGKAADPGFQMDGHQVGDDKGPIQLLLGGFQRPGVHDHRQRGGQPLVAAAGIDDDRQFAAVHPGVGAGGRPGFGPVVGAVAVGFQQDPPDVGPVLAAQPLPGNGRVAVDLPLQNGLDILQLHTVGKFHDPLHTQQRPVGGVLDALLGIRAVQQDLPVRFQPDHVGVVAGDLGERRVPRRRYPNLDVKNVLLIRRQHPQFHFLLVIGHPGDLLGGKAGQDLQLRVGIAGHDARSGGCLQPALPAGVGHDHALDVLDDVGAGAHFHLPGQAAQGLPGQRSAVRHGNGLGAAHRRPQFFLQDGAEFLVDLFVHEGASPTR